MVPLAPLLRRLPRLLLRLVLGLVLFSALQVLAVRFVDPPFTLTMLGRVWDTWEDTGRLAWPDHRNLPLESLGRWAPRMAVAGEDDQFWTHGGFDWEAIADAWESNQTGRKLRGGSTISQQVARNVFLWQRRSWLRKGLETWYTVLLELALPKRRILELYLNVAETGPMCFGFEAAAQRWFRKPAARLTADEAARIVAILPAPRDRDPRGAAMGKRAARIRANDPGDRKDPD